MSDIGSTTMVRQHMRTPTLRTHQASASTWIGLAAVVFSVLYFVSDLMELVNGGFTLPQLVLTYVSEAAIPVLVLGLYAVQRPQIGTLGLLGAVGYAYTYVFFTGTVLLAIVNRPPNWDALVGDLGPWVTLHGVLMVVAGTAFGVAVIRAGTLPRWTGVTLMAGVVLVVVSSVLPSMAQTVCAGVRDLGFAGMGLALLMHTRQRRQPATPTTDLGAVHVHA